MQKLALRLQIGSDLLELSKDRGVVGFPGRRVVWISVHYQQHEFHREPSTDSALNERAPTPEQSAKRRPTVTFPRFGGPQYGRMAGISWPIRWPPLRTRNPPGSSHRPPPWSP